MATISDLTEIVPSERIERALRTANLANRLGMFVADAMAVPMGTGSTVKVPYPEADSVPAGTKTENAEFDLTDTTMAEASVAAGTVGYSEEISNELKGEALYDAVEVCVQNKAAHLADRVDADILSLMSSFSNQSGTTNTDLTEAIALGAMFAYEAQNPQETDGPIVFIMSSTMLQNWVTNIGSAGGTWTQGLYESERIASLVKPIAGVKGMRFDMVIATSSNTPTSGGDAIGGIFGAGRRGPALFRSWRPITVESRYLPRQQCHELTVSTRYGTAVARDADARGVLADN